MCSRMSCCSLNMTLILVGTGVSRHFGKASLALCTAALNSAAVVRGRRESTCCVACSAPDVCISKPCEGVVISAAQIAGLSDVSVLQCSRPTQAL